jgi:hypothetical protein
MQVRVFALAAACALCAGTAPAEAQHFDTSGNIQWGSSGSDWSGSRRGTRAARYAEEDDGRSSLGAGSVRFTSLGPRPRRWCGWWMRSQKGGGPEFNVAWNWRKYGSPATPQVGAIVVWRHHVGMIVGRAENGQWIVRSGNDGGRVRTRARSVAGAIFRM